MKGPPAEAESDASPLDALLERLVARGHRGMVLDPSRMRRALDRVGNPHAGLRAFHVAGSNGKGSVCAMIDASLRAEGLKTGLYTSPHLERFNERIAIAGEPIGDEAFASALARTFRDGPDELTFFETLTVAAFLAFQEAKIDVAVLEVGLGGRGDATNVIAAPLAAGVVSITRGLDGQHLEHSAFLGTTPEQIAAEKAAIFKRDRPAIIGPMDEGPRHVCEAYARQIGAREIVCVENTVRPLAEGALALGGAHQRSNARVAVAMIETARDRLPIGDQSILEGLRTARWPGRLERITRGAISVLLDAAHNIDGARTLHAALSNMPLDPATTNLVFGALADKAWAPFLELIAPFAARRFYAEPGGRAPAPLGDLARVAPGELTASAEDAIERAIRATPAGGTVLVTGSIYLVGSVRAWLTRGRRDPAIGL